MEGGVFLQELDRALASRATLVAFLTCDAIYSGRAETYLPVGERILVVKSDHCVLLHQPDGTVPINYMKAGSQITHERRDGRLVLRCFNAKEKAWLELTIHEVHECIVRKLEDGQILDLAGNERDMSDFLRDHPEHLSKTFKPYSREEQTDVGFIDLLGHDGKGTLIVVECKRVTASLAAVDQLRRYVERVQHVRGAKKVKGVLAAPGITANASEMLSSYGFSFAKVDPPKRLEQWKSGQKGLGEF